jgi:hypothetical protein
MRRTAKTPGWASDLRGWAGVPLGQQKSFLDDMLFG